MLCLSAMFLLSEHTCSPALVVGTWSNGSFQAGFTCSRLADYKFQHSGNTLNKFSFNSVEVRASRLAQA